VRHLGTFAVGLLLGIIVGALIWASQPRPASGRAPTPHVGAVYEWTPFAAPTGPARTPEATPWPPATPPPATRTEPAQVAVPVTPKPSPGPTRRVRGTATWYCGSICTRGYPSGLYAAAGSELRTGDWRGRRVRVTVGGRSVVVTLVDWCACRGERVIDLYAGAFRRLAPLSRGVVGVTVSW